MIDTQASGHETHHKDNWSVNNEVKVEPEGMFEEQASRIFMRDPVNHSVVKDKAR